MSQPPKDKAPARRVSTVKPSDRPSAGASDARSTGNAGSGASRPVSASSAGRPVQTSRPVQNTAVRRTVNRNAPPPRRDPFPYVMGGVIGALIVGLMAVVFLLSSGNNSGGGTPAGGPGNVPGITVNPNPQNQNPQAIATSPGSSATASAGDAIRMPITDFMKLYNDPAQRPVIVDVRSKQAYEQGHIAGAINIPDVEMETRLSELPKDKLIVAYCQ